MNHPKEDQIVVVFRSKGISSSEFTAIGDANNDEPSRFDQSPL